MEPRQESDGPANAGNGTKSSAMIEDPELRELFAAESEEHLQQLEEGLLHLERHPDDMAMLKDLFREAHSLKGAARMLGVRDVEVLAHHFEDFLGAASKGQQQFTPLDVDRLTRSLDDIRALVQEAVTGHVAAITLPEALGRLTQPAPSPGAGGGAPRDGEREVAPVPDRSPPPPAPVLPSAPPFEPRGAVPAAAPVLPSAPPFEPRGAVSAAAPVLPSAPPFEPRGAVPAAAPVPAVAPHPVEQAALTPTEPRPSGAVVVAPAPVAPPPSTPPPAPAKEAGHMAAAAPEGSEAAAVDGKQGEGGEETASVIRVRAHKLDALLRLVGELTVVRTRVKRRLREVEEILLAWEEHTGDYSEVGELGMEGSSRQEQVTLHVEQLGGRLLQLRHGISEDEAGLELVAEALEEGIRNLRLLPMSTLFSLFPRLVRDLARQQQKEVRLLTEGGETAADKRILEEMKSPLMHLIRNAVDHGLESGEQREQAGKPREGTILLHATQTATHVVLEVRDDGRGLDIEAIRRQARKRGLFTDEVLATFSAEQLYPIIFQSGFSTSTLITDVSGRGVGLDVVRAQVERLKGQISVTSGVDNGCCFTLSLPITLATTAVFIASANDQLFAIPLDVVHSVRRVIPEEIFPIEGCDTIALNERPVSVASLAQLLELPPTAQGTVPPPWPCIIINMGGGWLVGGDL